MTINARIKYLRKEILKLNQKDFGERIGLKQNAISDMEKGRYAVTDSNAKLICQEFNISEAWLRNGEGNIYAESSRNIIDELKKQYGMTDEQYACMCAFLSLERNEREFFIEIVEKFAQKQRAFDPLAAQNGSADIGGRNQTLNAGSAGQTANSHINRTGVQDNTGTAQEHTSRTDVPANNGTVSDAERAAMHRQLDKQIDSKGKLSTSPSGDFAGGDIA